MYTTGRPGALVTRGNYTISNCTNQKQDRTMKMFYADTSPLQCWFPMTTTHRHMHTNCLEIQCKAEQQRRQERRGRYKETKSKPVRGRCHCANPSHPDLTTQPTGVRLTTGQGCLWPSHRRNGWKGLWCWSCSAWLQNENMELLVSQPMTAVGNH